jgi:predicted P-loop ATPase
MPLIAAYEHERATVPAVADVSWSDLGTLLGDHTEGPCGTPDNLCKKKSCAHKYGQAWSPVAYTPGAPLHRHDDNISHVTCAVFDLDHLTEAVAVKVAHLIEPYTYLIHSTHSNTPPNDRCLRLVMPLTEPVPAALWKHHVFPSLIKHLGLEGIADPVCKNVSRIFFLPSCPIGGEKIFEQGTGRIIDWRSLGPFEDETPVIAVPTGPTVAIDLEGLRKCIKEQRYVYARGKGEDAERYALLDRILKGEELAPPYQGDNLTNQAMSIIANAVPKGTPFEAVLEIIRPSINTMSARPDQHPWDCRCNHRDPIGHWTYRAQDTYDRAVVRRAEHEAQQESFNTGFKKLAERVAKSKAPPDANTASLPIEDAHPAAYPAGESWLSELIMTAEGTGLKSCGHNVALILENGEEFTNGNSSFIRWNDVTKDVEVSGGPFVQTPIATLDVAISNHLQVKYGVGLSPREVGSQILYVARKNPYDPIADYLNALVWDGVKRADDFLLKWCDALVTTDGDDINYTPHVKRISGKWLISCVARALRPGSKVDTVLILQGEQGLKKSMLFDVLGGAWFTDSGVTVGDKDSRMLAARSWIIEMPELSVFRHSEDLRRKAFFSQRVDHFRPPFGRVIEEYPRRCIFVGTTNDDQYLTDPTGHRRYWPVALRSIDIETLKANRDQLWAEAVYRYKAGERWWLEKDEAKEAEKVAEEHVVMTASEEKFLAVWASWPQAQRGPITTLQVAERVLGLTADRFNRQTAMDIGNTLKKLGFKRRRKRSDAGVIWHYEPPAHLVTMATVSPTRADHLRLIANAPMPVTKG